MNEITHVASADVTQFQPDPMVAMIERVVLNPDADLDKLERMLEMKARMDAQNARVSFSRALAAARAEIPPIIKDANVDYSTSKGRTHYKHETLAGIAKAIDPVLSKFGLSYRFRTDQGQGGVRVTCIITHADGHSEETTLAGAPDGSGSKNSFQAVGSAVTYLQRYTLKAALGLSAEVDDDGQSAAPTQDERPADTGQRRQQERDKPQDPDAAVGNRVADEMIASIRNHGVRSVQQDQGYQRDFARLKKEFPQAAARVESEIAKLSSGSTNQTDDRAPLVDEDTPY